VSGEEYTFSAKTVINATGIFADNIGRMDNPLNKPSIKPSQGIHIVLDRSFLKSNSAIMIPKTVDERVLFAIPWYDEVIIGTTDTPVDKIALEPVALQEEVDFILSTAGKYLTKAPARKDILCVFAGLRPLAANPGNPSSTREVSRRHKLIISPSGLITIIGGKWTTYRRMAEETIDKAIRAGFLDKRECVTMNLKLSEISGINKGDPLIVYGDGICEIKEIISNDPSMGKPVDKRLPYTPAEIIWICRNEMPLTVEDLLARRTHALLLNARVSLDIAGEVAGIMANELDHDLEWQKNQVEAYRQLVTKYT
jgi:glycerol-3-phosphate dehydrogenase